MNDRDEGPLVGVRYVGPRERKEDTLLGRAGREWKQGEVLQVPAADAAEYLKFPAIWRAADERGELPERVLLSAPSPAKLLEWIEAGDYQQLRLAGRDDLAALVEYPPVEFPPIDPRENVPPNPLAAEDAERLIQYVPSLARSMLLGSANSVIERLEMVSELLVAYPPLRNALYDHEQEDRKRAGVLRVLDSVVHDDLLRAVPAGQDTREQVGDEAA